MAGTERIAASLKHVVEVFEENPSKALGTNKTSAHLQDGLKCIVRERDHSAVVDMVEAMGGDAAGPSPGFFGRAALTSCIAIGIKMTAARADIRIGSIDVEVEMDWDNRGLLGLGDAPAATTGIRVFIAIQSKAPAQAIQTVVQESLKNSPWLQTFLAAQVIEPVIRITRGSDA
jgi:uncharacterized OsmC-like protein